MMLRRLLLLVFTLLLGVSSLMAQDDDKPAPSSKPPTDGEFQGFKKPKKFDWTNLILEPNFQLSIGQTTTELGLSPYVGYRVWKGLYLGGGVTYFWTRYTLDQFYNGATIKDRVNFHTYGGGVFAQYNVWRGFFLRTRFEVLHRQLDDYRNPRFVSNGGNSYKVEYNKIQRTIPSLLMGVGYNLLQSKNFFFPITVSYNVLHNVTEKQYSIYPRGLVVQLGFVNLF